MPTAQKEKSLAAAAAKVFNPGVIYADDDDDASCEKRNWNSTCLLVKPAHNFYIFSI